MTLNHRTTYRRAGTPRLQPKTNILENRWLHQLFLLTYIPAKWPAWQLGLGLLAHSGLVWLLWLWAGPVALTAAALYLAFALVDWLLLSWLPQARRSYGPIGPQLVVMTAPRLGVALLTGLVGLWWSQPVGLLGAFIGLQLVGTTAYLWGMIYEPFLLTTSHVHRPSPYLPVQAAPIRLLHLSDFHIERLTPREAMLPDLIHQAQPDLIVITGDYLNLSYVDDPLARSEVRRLLAKLHAPYGVYATLGSPPVDPRETTPALFEGLDIRLLRDEVAVLDLGQGRRLSLIGLDCEHDLESDRSAFEQLIPLAPPDSMRVLLYHSPELMPLAQQYPVDLYLCGHTHGGQVRIPPYGALLTSSSLGKQYEVGRYDEQNTTLYISRGIGLEGLSAPRMRLFCPPEIILFTLSGETA